MPIIWRFNTNLQGRIGSRTPLESVTWRSQKIRDIQRSPDTVNKVMTYADFHGNFLSASSKAAVKASVANRIRTVPGISIRLSLFPKETPVFFASRLGRVWLGKSFGIANNANRNAGTPSGTLLSYMLTNSRVRIKK